MWFKRRQQQTANRVTCPCCGFLTLRERGFYELCPVCFWEDDGQDNADADVVRMGPNGTISLSDARRNYAEFRASQRPFVSKVRPPTVQERTPL